MMRVLAVLLGVAVATGVSEAQTLNCDLHEYRARRPSRPYCQQRTRVDVAGRSAQELRAQFGLRDGQPVVQELAARKAGGAWVVLGKDLTPEFQVTTGRRRMSGTEKDILGGCTRTRRRTRSATSGTCSGTRRWRFRD